MAPRNARHSALAGAVAFSCVFAGLRFLHARSFAFLSTRGADSHAALGPLVSGQGFRRALLPAFGAVALPPVLPAAALEDVSEARNALYKGKAKDIRAAAEWWRFYIGDLIVAGTGKGSDGLKVGDRDCAAGFCRAGKSLQAVLKALTEGYRRVGGVALSQVDQTLLTPMYSLADIGVWDPDTSDNAKSQAADFQRTVRNLGDAIKRAPPDAISVQELYFQSLRQLNVYFASANKAFGSTNTEDWFLPQLPLSLEDLSSDPYWQQQRAIFDEATDPVAQFKDRQAIGSKEARQVLKKFPGATLLLR